jgi:hypothetical protein
MGRKILWATMAAIGLMAVTGVGFAAITPWTASGSATVNGGAGTVQFELTSVNVLSSATQADYNGNMQGCTPAGLSGAGTPSGGETLSISAYYMTIGDWCGFSFQVTNTGNIPGTYTVSAGTSGGSPSCWQWLPNAASSGVLAPGAHSGTITMALEVNDGGSGAPQTCEGSSADVTASISLVGAVVGENGESSNGLGAL